MCSTDLHRGTKPLRIVYSGEVRSQKGYLMIGIRPARRNDSDYSEPRVSKRLDSEKTAATGNTRRMKFALLPNRTVEDDRI